jgi:hypothetical protein
MAHKDRHLVEMGFPSGKLHVHKKLGQDVVIERALEMDCVSPDVPCPLSKQVEPLWDVGKLIFAR